MIRSRASHEVRRAAPLRADLHDALVLARRREHRLALDDVDADRLLHVDVGAGLHRLDHRQRVPVIRRGDEHDVEVLLLQHLAVVAVGARLLLRRLPRRDQLGRVGEHLLVDVAERDDFDRRDLDQPEQVALAVPAGADQPDPLARVRELLGVGGRSGQGEGRGGVLDEVSAMHGIAHP